MFPIARLRIVRLVEFHGQTVLVMVYGETRDPNKRCTNVRILVLSQFWPMELIRSDHRPIKWKHSLKSQLLLDDDHWLPVTSCPPSRARFITTPVVSFKFPILLFGPSARCWSSFLCTPKACLTLSKYPGQIIPTHQVASYTWSPRMRRPISMESSSEQ